MGRRAEVIDVLACLEKIVLENTDHYREDFQMDITVLTNAARNEPPGTAFFWMSRESGTWCEPERETFIKDSIAYKIWTYYEGSEAADRIRAYRIELHGMKGDTVLGSVTPLDYKTHIQRVIRSAVPYSHIRIGYSDGHTQLVDAGQDSWHRECDRHGEITEYSFVPADERALNLAIAAERTALARKPERRSKPKSPVR